MFKYVVLLLMVSFVTNALQEKRVNVSIYYEALCPYVKKFFITQLYTALQTNLSKHIDLDLIPYGKAKRYFNETLQESIINCDHGPNECYGNKLQACAIFQINDGIPSQNLGYNKITLDFIICLMKSKKENPSDVPVQHCAETNHVLHWKNLVICANGTDGNSLLDNYGKKTENLQPNLTSVPTIVFNNVYNKSDNEMAQTNFVKVLCSYIENKPMECFKSNTPHVTYNITMMLIALAVSIFNKFN